MGKPIIRICTRVFFYTLFISMSVGSSIAQTFPQSKELLKKTSQLLYSNPDEAIKIVKHLLKNNSDDDQKAILNLLLAKAYATKGNSNSAIVSIYEAGKYAKTIDDTTKIRILLLKSSLLRGLYLDSQSEKYLADALTINQRQPEKLMMQITEAHIVLNKIKMHLERRSSSKAQDVWEKNTQLFKEVSEKNKNITQDIRMVKAEIFSYVSELDSAVIYYNKSLLFSKELKNPNILEQAILFNELGRLYFQKKEHQKSIDILLKALDKAKKINNPVLLKSINRYLSINYLALNDRPNYKFFNNEFLRLNNILEQSEEESVNSAYNLISQEQESFFEAKRKEYAVRFYFVLAASILIILVCLVFWLKAKWRKKRLNEIVKYLEISKNVFSKIAVERKEPNKKIIIPAETEQAILTKLKRFEASTRFTSKEMSLAVMAGQFETNTKYLSEIINKHYQDNFNTYINKLRINFIIEKLKSDPNFMNYKISYLAEKSGFSSHSSFATVFKSITGIAPVTFIDLLKEETEQNKKEV